MDIEEFTKYTKGMIERFPTHRRNIIDQYEIACSEIESDGSIDGEIEHSVTAMRQLTGTDNEPEVI